MGQSPMRSPFTPFATVIAVAVLLAGCMGPAGPAPRPPPETPVITVFREAVINDSGYRLVVLDYAGRESPAFAADLSPDRTTLAIGFEDGSVEIWGADGTFTRALGNSTTGCAGGAVPRFLNSTAFVLGCTVQLRALDLHGKVLWANDTTGILGGVHAVAADGATFGLRGSISFTIWNRLTGQTVTGPLTGAARQRFDMSPDGRFVAGNGDEDRFFSIDYTSGTAELLRAVPRSADVQVSADGSLGIVGRTSNTLQVSHVQVVDLLNNQTAPTDLLVPEPYNDSRPAYTYEGERVWATLDARFVAWIDLVPLNSTVINETRSSRVEARGVYAYQRVVRIADLQDLTRSLGFAAGATIPYEGDPLYYTNGTVIEVFVAPDGSAMALTTSQDHYDFGHGPAVLTLAIAEAGTAPPQIRFP